VFFTDGGVPYYYVNDQIVYIPAHHPRYRYYRTHYSTNPGVYRTWHRQHGHQYRGYRQGSPRPYPGTPQPSVIHRPGPGPRHYGGPVHPVAAPGHVDCRVNPDHPACRRGSPRGPNPGPYNPGPQGPRPGRHRHR
jgi:hypothetical protein